MPYAIHLLISNYFFLWILWYFYPLMEIDAMVVLTSLVRFALTWLGLEMMV